MGLLQPPSPAESAGIFAGNGPGVSSLLRPTIGDFFLKKVWSMHVLRLADADSVCHQPIRDKADDGEPIGWSTRPGGDFPRALEANRRTSSRFAAMCLTFWWHEARELSVPPRNGRCVLWRLWSVPSRIVSVFDSSKESSRRIDSEYSQVHHEPPPGRTNSIASSDRSRPDHAHVGTAQSVESNNAKRTRYWNLSVAMDPLRDSLDYVVPDWIAVHLPLTSSAGLLGTLCGVCAFFFMLEKRTDWRLFHYLPPLIFIYLAPVVLSNSGLLPTSSPVYTGMKQLLLPMMLILLLLKVNVGGAVRVLGRGVGVMIFGTLGVVVGAPIGFLVVKPWLGADSWKAFGVLAGSWIGGTGNMAARWGNDRCDRRRYRVGGDWRLGHLRRLAAHTVGL